MTWKPPIAIRVWTVVALAGALSLGFAAAGETAAPAPHHGGHHGAMDHHSGADGFGRGEALKQVLTGLDLTDAQRAEIQDIIAKRRSSMRPLADDVIAARMELRAAVAAPTPDEAAIKAATERLVQAQTAAAMQHAQIAAEIRKTLTPGQQKLFDEHRAQLRDQVESRMRGRHHGRVDASDDDSSSETKK